MNTLKNKLLAKAHIERLELTQALSRRRRGDFAADKGVVIAITVALAGIALLIASILLKNTIGPELTKAIQGFFNFS